MKTIKTLGLISVFALVGFSATLDAQPLGYNQNSRVELQTAYEAKNKEVIALEYTEWSARRFCWSESGADWENCVRGVQTHLLSEVMIYWADLKAEAEYDISRQKMGRY